jgi:alkylation response protein AidB-like acyl-CoA dehydrogenase
MNFDLSEEQQMFVTSVERFAAPIDVEARRKLRLSPTGYDRARWQSLAEMGLIALSASEDAGGMGGSAVDLALVLEAIGKANAPDPLLEHGILPALLMERGGAGEALEGVLAGETIATLAWTERNQRYSLKAKGMKAEGTGDSFTLTGEKTMVMGALLADLFIVTGPGTTLGGAVAQSLILSGWRGMQAKADFQKTQSDAPVLLAMGMADQRAQLTQEGPRT